MNLTQALDSFRALDQSLEALVLALLLALVLSQLTAWVYSATHSGLSYSRTFTQSLVLMATVVTLVMFVIGNNIVTAFGLIGALAIIRFRNVLKDTRDTVFVFFVLVLGVAIGSQRFETAVVGTVTFVLLVLYLHYTGFGTLGRFDGHVTLRIDGDETSYEAVDRTLWRHCHNAKRISIRRAGEGGVEEILYQVHLRDRDRRQEMVAEIQGIEGVHNLSLVLRDELAEV